MRLFAQVATFVSNLFASLNNQKNPSNGGVSPNVPASVVDSTSTSTNVTDQEVTLVIKRDQRTTDAIFGKISLEGIKPNLEAVCYSMERIAVAIPAGSYVAHLEDSPHFGRPTPHIAVPSRTYIEIHPANYPCQLEGCVAVGTTRDNDALDNSTTAFDKLMALLPSHFTVVVIDI